MEKELIVKWKIKEGKTDHVLKLLPELAKLTQQEKGNLSYSIYQSESDSAVLFLHESYLDEQAIEVHKNSEHYQRIVTNQILPHLEIREVSFVSKLS